MYPDTTSSFRAGSYALVLDASFNIYVTGYAATQTGTWNSYCTIKYNSSGGRQWVSNYYGNNSGGRFSHSIALDSSRNVYVTGYSYEQGREFDYCTVKYDSNGVQQWIQLHDGPAHGIDQAREVAVDNAGNIYVSGFSSIWGSYGWIYATIKYSTNGEILWLRTFGNASSGTDVGGMKIDDSCNVYITGENGPHAVTIKYDSSGNQIWVNEYTIGGPQSRASTIAIDKDNSVFIAGYVYDPLSDCFTIKYSSEGVELWERKFNPDSMTNGRYWANSLVTDNVGNVYVNGVYRSNESAPAKIFTLKYLSDGYLSWSRNEPDNISSQYSTYINIDKSNNTYIAYSVKKDLEPIQYGIVKYDSSGMIKWKTKTEFQENTIPSCMNLGEDDCIFVTGAGTTKMYTVKYSQLVGSISNNEKTPKVYKLNQNYPNPFNLNTKINYELQITSHIKISVFDITGKEIAILVNEKQNTGLYKINFDGTNCSSGIYFYSLLADGDFIETKKMLFIK